MSKKSALPKLFSKMLSQIFIIFELYFNFLSYVIFKFESIYIILHLIRKKVESIIILEEVFNLEIEFLDYIKNHKLNTQNPFKFSDILNLSQESLENLNCIQEVFEFLDRNI